jgi:hypothetical protein
MNVMEVMRVESGHPNLHHRHHLRHLHHSVPARVEKPVIQVMNVM